MLRQRVTNHSLQSEMLESGQQLAASGRPGSVREDVELTAVDRARLVDRGIVTVVEITDDETATPATAESAEQSPKTRPRTRS